MSAPRLTPKLRAMHAAVLQAGAGGAGLSDLLQSMNDGSSMKALHNRLRRLRLLGLVKQEVERGPYFALQAPDSEAARTLRERCLALVADCPGGVSDEVMGQELGLDPSEVRRALRPALDAGQVVRVSMPQAHGGGQGWAAGVAPAALVPQSQGAAADAAGAFDLVDNERLAMAWNGARIVLPAEVTRGLFRYLNALGGLHNEQRLAGAGRGAGSAA